MSAIGSSRIPGPRSSTIVAGAPFRGAMTDGIRASSPLPSAFLCMIEYLRFVGDGRCVGGHLVLFGSIGLVGLGAIHGHHVLAWDRNRQSRGTCGGRRDR